MKTVVLGAGPVGLAAAEILRADLVIGERPGGADDLRRLAPTYVWRTPATERLAAELRVPAVPRAVRFGWIVRGGILSDVATPEERLAYYRRSRGLAPDALVKVPVSAASSGRPGEIDALDLPMEVLVHAVLRRRSVLPARVGAVEFSGEGAAVWVDCSSEPIRATALVNTLPAPVFSGLTGSVFSPLYAPGPKCFVLGEAWSPALHRERRRGRRSFFYVADPETPFDRVKIVPAAEGAPFSYEFNAAEPPPGFLDAVNGRLALSAPLQIPPGAPEVPRVQWGGVVWNVGRLARWSHGIRLHDAVEELYREGVEE